MKKLVIFIGVMLVLAAAAWSVSAVSEGNIQQADGLAINEECTVGVNHASITTHDSPVLWKVSEVPDKDLKHVPEDICNIVKYYSIDDWGTEHNFIAITYTWDDLEPHKKISMGLNEAGVGTGNSLVAVDDYDNNNNFFMFHVLGNFCEMSQIRAYIDSPLGQTEYNPSGCFPFIDSAGNASLFELDPSTDEYWEYDTMDPDRESQGLLGFVVRDNRFHLQDDGTDDTGFLGRYWKGIENMLGLIAAGEFNEQSLVQSDSEQRYRVIRYSDRPWPISNDTSRNAHAIRGAAPGEDPALATMWALLGNPSFSIAVPTWAAVSDIPDPISTCKMFNAVTTLYNEATSDKGKQIKETWVQAAVLPAEAHLFDMVNERLLPHWRTLGGPPAIEEMTRIEHQMAQDAYSVVNYLATTGDHNLAPTVDFEAHQVAGTQYKFMAEATDADGGVASYLWNFGDGTTSSEVAPVYEFPGAGVYLVSVTTADDDAVTSTAWRYLTVGED